MLNIEREHKHAHDFYDVQFYYTIVYLSYVVTYK